MKAEPTHSKFNLFEDVQVSGTEIILKIKSTLLQSDDVEAYVKKALNYLFLNLIHHQDSNHPPEHNAASYPGNMLHLIPLPIIYA
jgi:hypothetical protein